MNQLLERFTHSASQLVEEDNGIQDGTGRPFDRLRDGIERERRVGMRRYCRRRAEPGHPGGVQSCHDWDSASCRNLPAAPGLSMIAKYRSKTAPKRRGFRVGEHNRIVTLNVEAAQREVGREPASALHGTPSRRRTSTLLCCCRANLPRLTAAPAPASRPVRCSRWSSDRHGHRDCRRRHAGAARVVPACARSQAREAHRASHPPSAMRRPAPRQAPHRSFRGSRSQARRIPAGRSTYHDRGRPAARCREAAKCDAGRGSGRRPHQACEDA